MSKIGIDCRLWGVGNTGIGRYVQELVENLHKIDSENEYVLFCRKNDIEKINMPGWKKVVADIPHYSFLEQTKLVQIFLRENLDLLHTPHFNVPILYPRPFVITIHDLLWHKSYGTKVTNLSTSLYWGKYAAYRIAVKFAVKKARKIIVPSHAVEKDVVNFFPKAKKKISVTYEGAPGKNFQFPISNFQSILNKYKIKKPYFLYVGNLYPHKNVEKSVLAMEQLEGVELVIVSGRSVFAEKFQKFLQREEATSWVKMLGRVSDEELAQLYKNAQAFVFPTLSEGFGLPGLEAMSVGCPVVCSNIPVLKEIYRDAALYFDPQNVSDITDKVKRILTDKTLQKRLIKSGEEQVKKYSWKKMVYETLKVYKEVLALQGLTWRG